MAFALALGVFYAIASADVSRAGTIASISFAITAPITWSVGLLVGDWIWHRYGRVVRERYERTVDILDAEALIRYRFEEELSDIRKAGLPAKEAADLVKEAFKRSQERLDALYNRSVLRPVAPRQLPGRKPRR